MSLLSPRTFYLVSLILCLQNLAGCGSSSAPAGDCTLGSTANVDVTGTVTFDLVRHSGSGALNYNDIIQSVAQGVTVEAVCNSVIASTSTDINGDYSLPIPGETDNVFIRVKAEMKATGTPSWDVSVVDNTQSKALYSMVGAKFNSGTQNAIRDLRADSGWTGAAYGSTRVAGPFAILNSVNIAIQKILTADNVAVFPPLKINWSVDNVPVDGEETTGQIGTSFYNGLEIFILGDENSDTDEYDEHVIIHEWAHYFENKFSRADNIGGLHSAVNRLDMRVAFGEGFGNAFSAIATDDPVYSDSQQNTSSFQLFIDSNNSCINAGWFNECSVHTILYDLYDLTDDGNDTLSLGFTPLYSVLVNEQKNTDALTSIFSFISELKTNVSTMQNGAGINAAINTLLAGTFTSVVADEFGAGENNDAGVAIATDVIPVYTNITAGASVSPLCVIDDFGETISTGSVNEFYNRNRLSSYRFLIFTPSVTKNYTIKVDKVNDLGGSFGTDPDIAVFQKGVKIISAISTTTNTESLTTNLTAGITYIIQINDFGVTFSTNSIGRTCFNVAVLN